MSLFKRPDRLPRIKALPKRRSRLISVLDIGSTNITCLIARLKPRAPSDMLPGRTHAIEVLGTGRQRAAGIKSGVVMDMDLAERAVRLCVDAAEASAGLSVESLIVSVTGGRIKSLYGHAEADLDGPVDEADLEQVIAEAARVDLGDSRLALHSLAKGLSVDGEHGVTNVVGMRAERLGVDAHVLSVEETPLRNLEAVINRAQIMVEAFVATSYASALSTLVEDEARMGSACIDLGGGSSKIAIFQDGCFIYADHVALGGDHVTMDLARGLSISFADAERLKVMYASTQTGFMDDEENVPVTRLGGDGQGEAGAVSRSLISRIVRPRVEETLELIRDRLAASGVAHVIGKRVVLTGGASQLGGITESARTILKREVRLGRPMGVAGLDAASKGPAYATAVGLLIHPQVAHREHAGDAPMPAFVADPSTRVGRFGTWLRKSL